MVFALQLLMLSVRESSRQGAPMLSQQFSCV